MQFGVNVPAGAETLHKVLTAKSEEFPDHVFASVDVRSAFRRVRRRKLFRALRSRCPDLEALARQWYDREGKHVASGLGRDAKLVSQVLGLDEGCPLSPAFFAIAMAPALDDLRGELRTLSAETWVYAYLDDVYLVVPRRHLGAAMLRAQTVLGELGLALNPTKTKIWFPSGPPQDVPAWLQPCVVSALPCLGSTVTFVRRRDLNGDVVDEWRD
eukprot:5480888-Karenia_brevis.AAC.1